MKIKNNKKIFGSAGEEIAVKYLKTLGYKIKDRNYRIGRLGEIDIIARDAEYICFIEVKTRRGIGFGTPSEAVTWQKRHRLIRLAGAYLTSHGCENEMTRFDIVEVLDNGSGNPEINLIRNAFGNNLV